MREFLYQRLPEGVPQSVVDSLLDTHGDVGEQAALFAEANSPVPDATKFWPYLLDDKWYIGPGKLIGERDSLTPEQQSKLSRYQSFGISQEAGYLLAIEQAQQAIRDTDQVIKSNKLRAMPQGVRDALVEATALEGPEILDTGVVASLKLRDYDGAAELISVSENIPEEVGEAIVASGNAPGTEDLVTEVMRNTAINETGRADFSKMGQIAREANGTKSYGILGLNSGDNTSGPTFIEKHGESLGLTAPIGSTEFDAQWAAATDRQLPELLAAHEQYVETDLIAPAQDILRRSGNNKFSKDAGVINTISDAIVQYGPGITEGHLKDVSELLTSRGTTGNDFGSTDSFYDAYENITVRKLPINFRTHLSKFPEQLNGLENRARARVAQGRALSASPGNLPAPRRSATVAQNQPAQSQTSTQNQTPPAQSLGVNTDTPEQIAKTESSGVDPLEAIVGNLLGAAPQASAGEPSDAELGRQRVNLQAELDAQRANNAELVGRANKSSDNLLIGLANQPTPIQQPLPNITNPTPVQQPLPDITNSTPAIPGQNSSSAATGQVQYPTLEGINEGARSIFDALVGAGETVERAAGAALTAYDNAATGVQDAYTGLFLGLRDSVQEGLDVGTGQRAAADERLRQSGGDPGRDLGAPPPSPERLAIERDVQAAFDQELINFANQRSDGALIDLAGRQPLTPRQQVERDVQEAFDTSLNTSRANEASDRQLIELARAQPAVNPAANPAVNLAGDFQRANIDDEIAALRAQGRERADRDVMLRLLGLSDSLTSGGQAQAQRSGAALDSISANASAGGVTNADLRAAAPTNPGGLTAKNIASTLNALDKQSSIYDPANDGLLNYAARDKVLQQKNATRLQLGLPVLESIDTLPRDIQSKALTEAYSHNQLVREQYFDYLKKQEDNLRQRNVVGAQNALLNRQTEEQRILEAERQARVAQAANPLNLNIPTGR